MWEQVHKNGAPLLAYHDEAGTVGLVINADGLYNSALLCGLKVAKEHRHQGHGTKLIKTAIDKAKSLRLRTLTIVDENPSFWHTQRKYGWEDFSSFLGQEDEHWMILDLHNHGY